ncbi:MAG: ATP-binding protein [Pseudomonadota bacterium]
MAHGELATTEDWQSQLVPLLTNIIEHAHATHPHITFVIAISEDRLSGEFFCVSVPPMDTAVIAGLASAAGPSVWDGWKRLPQGELDRTALVQKAGWYRDLSDDPEPQTLIRLLLLPNGLEVPTPEDFQHADRLADLVAGAHDVTDLARKQAQHLDQARRRIGVLEASLPDFVMRATFKGDLIFMNSSLKALVGLSGHDLPLPLTAVLGDTNARKLVDELRQRPRSRPELTTSIVIKDAEGEERVVRWAHVVVFHGDTPMEIVSVGRDATQEQHQVSDLMRRAIAAEFQNQEKTTILENISHEIRTPLNAIVGMAQVLVREKLTREQHQMLDTIQKAGRQVAGLLDSIRDFERVGSGTASLDYTPFRAADLVNEVSEMMRAAMDTDTQKLSINLDLSTQMPIEGDKTRIKQVLTNLLTNAVRHAGPSEISVSADVSQTPGDNPGLLTVIVSDTGRGIDASVEDVIFERFSRGYAVTDPDKAGMGLGLSISSGICALHGGELLLQPTPGGGATFIATFEVLPSEADVSLGDMPLPLRPQPSVEGPDFSDPDMSPGDVLKLLVAEDNRMNQEVLQAMLAGSPVQLTFVEDGVRALEALKADTFDGALIDIRMPVMNGIEFATVYRELKEHGLVTDMPLVACSADPMVGRLPKFRDAGFQRALTKPITQIDLEGCLDWIRERREIGETLA